MSSKSMHRRDFLFKAGVGAATVGALSSCAELTELSNTRSQRSSDVRNWDKSVDVLIVGSGAAGICAAIEAALGGADVLILEKFGNPGGTTALSGGVCYLGGGTALQSAAGFSDTAENMYNYMVAAGGPHPHASKIQRYCEGSVSHFDWLVDAGVPYNNQFKASKGFPEKTDDSLYYSGNEAHPSFAEIAEAAPRGHVPSVTGHGGWKLMEVLTAKAKSLGVRIALEHSAERLVQEDDGRVVGLVCEHKGETLNLQARWGVMLASGGFIRNTDMVRKYAPELADLSTPHAGPGDLGIGIQMGLAAGGEAIRMNQALVTLPLYPPERVLKGILVNQQGQRFIAEDMYHNNIGWDAAIKQGGTVYLIGDQTSDYNGEGFGFYEKVASGDSMYTLERFLGIAIGSLQMTVQLYNQNAYWGKDTQYGKAKEFVAPVDTPPYHAYRLDTRKDFCPTFTFGGLNTTVSGKVVDVWGDVIPGLYAAGRCASGVPSAPYLGSGASVGDASFFGRLVGKSLAAEFGRASAFRFGGEKQEELNTPPEAEPVSATATGSAEQEAQPAGNGEAETAPTAEPAETQAAPAATAPEPPPARDFEAEAEAEAASESADDWMSFQKSSDGT